MAKLICSVVRAKDARRLTVSARNGDMFAVEFVNTARCGIATVEKRGYFALVEETINLRKTEGCEPGLVGQCERVLEPLGQQLLDHFWHVGRDRHRALEAAGERLRLDGLLQAGAIGGDPDPAPRQLAGKIRHEGAVRSGHEADQVIWETGGACSGAQAETAVSVRDLSFQSCRTPPLRQYLLLARP